MIGIADTELMREIYGIPNNFAKSSLYDHFLCYGERPIFATLAASDHRRKRRLSTSFYQKPSIQNPEVEAFVRDRLSALFKQINATLECCCPQDSINIYPLFNWFAFDNITRLLYGTGHGSYTIERDCREREILLKLKQASIWGPFRFNFPKFFGSRLSKTLLRNGYADALSALGDLASWNNIKLDQVCEHGYSETGRSLFQHLLTSTDKDPEALSQRYISSEVLDNLNAAQETVSVALIYVAYRLSRHPDWQDRLFVELAKLPREDDGYPSFADIDGMPLLEAFVNEVLRLHPGTSGRHERIVPQGGIHCGDVFIPADVIVSVSTIALHHNEFAFPSADVFDPNRWLGGSYEEYRAMCRCFAPFGYGSRICIGRFFAELQIKILTTGLCLKYHLRIGHDLIVMEKTMRQTGTMDAVPVGLRCDLILAPRGIRTLEG
ncbi:Cytochrome P450 [Elaphomyces granulatus]